MKELMLIISLYSRESRKRVPSPSEVENLAADEEKIELRKNVVAAEEKFVIVVKIWLSWIRLEKRKKG